jgi:hypothetical protein
MALRLITAPVTQPITLAAAKLHLRIAASVREQTRFQQ